jgi:hypothetical protein
MPINKATLDTTVNLLTALAQRQEVIRQLAAQLAGGQLWRSPDGTLAVTITDAQREELTTHIVTYLDESQAIIDIVRAQIKP